MGLGGTGRRRDIASEREALRKHPYPGRALLEWIIPRQEHSAFLLQRGQILRLIDIAGKQVPDLVCFNAHDHADRLSQSNSQLLNKHRQLVQGDVLYSVDCNPMLTITDYSNEVSFAHGSMCSEQLNRIRYGVANTRNCRDNFAMALEPWGMGKREIPDAFVPFMRVEVDEDGAMEIREPTTVPGDYYDLRAEMDLLVAVSNCPQELNPCNGFSATEMGIVICETT